MTRRWNDRLALLNWRSSLVTLALVGMVAVSALGAWAVRDSWLEHQRAVDQTLDAYAAYAARAFYTSAANESRLVRQLSMASVLGSPAYPDDPLPLERFAQAAGRVIIEHTGLVSDPARGFYRVDVGTGRYTAMGKAAEPDVAREIRDVVRAERPVLDTTQQAYNWLLQAGSDGGQRRVSTSLAPRRDAEGRLVAVYGFTLSWQESFAPLMRRAVPGMMLLPPSLPGADVAGAPLVGLDTLVSLRIITTDGFVYYETPRQFTSSASGSFLAPGTPMRFQATLHPDLVASLRRQMMDDSRRRLQLALPILSVLFAIAAILHIRRERELVRARRDFVASVSHELRTPLAQIRMFSETLLLRREDSEEERLRWLAIIGREARRLGDLVENILLFSHIDAARVRLEPERTDLGELVEEVVEAYVPIAEARRMRIVADAPSRIFAVVDPRAMRQVVVNLIDNALKYGPPGQTVTVEVDRTDGHALLTVADQGPGVPSRDRARLWRPFVRLANGGSSAGGSGIGLSVVRSLVEQHGGTVGVDDAAGAEEAEGAGGVGARFTVTLPIAGDHHVTAAHRAAVLSRG